ncbi:FAD-dependent monooxygenase [Spelaeicoccus albus]|uniref:2-polyprenyl-6-methoxyphenol hydroxylase-like FAD-dependent oxidoreductase n=1 Tax=Spelaeicoccus albus TaxID=1280376 RepID=A0A7Z0D0A0_9MICO|nr:FAD-dependent monooxygenase [Spelaeicoccus albus]NYI67136.1 2-polyprenyl-6-methoxyphenol hydroxylase-like FAD-dependent oxidoreductase [Spelaeicoccus albus]
MKVLISGAGIAGATAAALLGRIGHRVTVVERDQGVRSSGNPVDVRGRAYDVARRLGLVSQLREASTHVRELAIVNSVGRRVAGLATQKTPGRELEVPRTDLCSILIDAARDDVDFRFDDVITGLESGTHGVDATFDRAPGESFDLVIGADGLHSNVRRMAYGPDRDYIRHLGMYIATVRMAGPPERSDAVLMYNEPGTAIALHPGTGNPVAALMFRSRARVDPRDKPAAASLLEQRYASGGWRTAEVLAAFRGADDTYFDAISRVRVPRWSRGRTTLLGDAASCVSLFGDGSSSAMSGAMTLAEALDDSPRDVTAALGRYERVQRVRADRGQRAATPASHVLIPASRTGITLRNAVLGVAGRR